jgi:hypothetical protein
MGSGDVGLEVAFSLAVTPRQLTGRHCQVYGRQAVVMALHHVCIASALKAWCVLADVMRASASVAMAARPHDGVGSQGLTESFLKL